MKRVDVMIVGCNSADSLSRQHPIVSRITSPAISYRIQQDYLCSMGG